MKYHFVKFFFLFLLCAYTAVARNTYNFNSDWLLHVGDTQNQQFAQPTFDDAQWQHITLPRAFNEDEAFRVPIAKLTDTIVWYRKHFRLPKSAKDEKIFIEFEGVRQAAEVWLNGQRIGLHENGVMAFGFDLTPYIKYGGENVIAVRVDNNWEYREQATNSKYQWSSRNFNANYGGIPKNVWLHVTDKVYQTLPLYNSLKTTGVYVYADNFDVAAREALIHAEAEVCNGQKTPVTVALQMEIVDADGHSRGTFTGASCTFAAGQTQTIGVDTKMDDLHFWSWGYGYLYTVKTRLVMDGRATDEVATRTGFRKTRFAEGKLWLNDRVLMVHGYAQRTSNEWPGVGMSVPPWLSDYSNAQMVAGNGNLVRWMHVTPWKQDVESCDRVGLLQAMPAGDAEADAKGRQWEMREELMRDAIIYNRNNPSIIFYECGNKGISPAHMEAMKAIRDKFDPHGGRAIGSREMLDDHLTAEYGGEMLYINKSNRKPLWAMEYCRDEGLRKYWDAYSFPYHAEGAGPLYRNADASAYNHNQDEFVVELVRRWFDYWQERPGTGERVSSGGVKIVYSDTQTHCRGEENYRRSGVVDALRIPKDAYFAHQVMWNGWVDSNEKPQTYIVGHWNYAEAAARADTAFTKPVYVVSNGEKVELFLNGRSLGYGQRDYNFLFTFPHVPFEAGTLHAVSYNVDGQEISDYELSTAGAPARLKLTVFQAPDGLKADGADLALVQVEVVDANGRRCPLDNRAIRFTLDGAAEWRGGMAQGENNCTFTQTLPVECGVNRVLLRSTTKAGRIKLTAVGEGLPKAEIALTSKAVRVQNGLCTFAPRSLQPCLFTRGETPSTPSYKDVKHTVRIIGATAASQQKDAAKSYDDDETTQWRSQLFVADASITYQFQTESVISEVVLKLGDWRNRSYPLEVLAGDSVVWSGNTPKSLGYVHLPIKPVSTDKMTIRLKGKTRTQEGFGQIVELADEGKAKAKRKDDSMAELRIIEAEFLTTAER